MISTTFMNKSITNSLPQTSKKFSPSLFQILLFVHCNNSAINEPALLSSGLRFVFDASWAISIFALNDSRHWSNGLVKSSIVSDIEKGSQEYDVNSYLAALYGSSSLHEINYFGVVKLLKCDGHYLLINTTEDLLSPYSYKR